MKVMLQAVRVLDRHGSGESSVIVHMKLQNILAPTKTKSWTVSTEGSVRSNALGPGKFISPAWWPFAAHY